MTKPHNKELRQLALTHFNEPMISWGSIVRCIGYQETGVDCYLITSDLFGVVGYHTCVGGYVFLDKLKCQNYVKSSGGEDWDDLVRLSIDLTRGGSPPAEKFIEEYDHDNMEGMERYIEGLND